MISIPLVTLAATKILSGRPCILCGFCLTPGAGGAGVTVLYDGNDNTGTPVAALAQAANTVSIMGPNNEGPFCGVGLFFGWASGSWTGAVWVKI